MSRAEKVRKLANAVREYRGSTSSTAEDAVWRIPPKPSASPRVRVWLDRLKLDAADCMLKIREFKTYDEFNAWLRTIG